MTDTAIYVTEGERRFVGGILHNVQAGDTVNVAVGPYDPPPASSAAQAPTSTAQGATATDLIVRLRIDDSYPLATGRYVWAWLGDVNEIRPFRIDGPYAFK